MENPILANVAVGFGSHSRSHREPGEILSSRATWPTLRLGKSPWVLIEDGIVVGTGKQGGRPAGRPGDSGSDPSAICQLQVVFGVGASRTRGCKEELRWLGRVVWLMEKVEAGQIWGTAQVAGSGQGLERGRVMSSSLLRNPTRARSLWLPALPHPWLRLTRRPLVT